MSNASLPLMRLNHTSKCFSGKRVLEPIDLSICIGNSIAIIGHNGSGKSTLLRIISGLIRPTRGTREVFVNPLRIGYVPDRFPILRFTPREYLTHMGKLQGLASPVLVSRIRDLLKWFSLDFAEDQRMTSFSKGMLQKVNLMQAILEEPHLLILDEPLSGLDQDSKEELVSLLSELKRKALAMIVVSHERILLETISDRIITMENGRVVDDLVTSEATQIHDAVVIQVTFLRRQDESEIEYLSGVLHLKTLEQVSTLLVKRQECNHVLQRLIQINAVILSLNSSDAIGPAENEAEI